SGMVGQVIAMGEAEYQQWLSAEAEGSLALKGRQVFLQYRCVSCHSADSGARAPTLESLFDTMVALNNGKLVRADHTYLRDSILHASAQIVAGYRDIMPPFDGQITEEQVLALVAFIQSLKSGETPRRVETYPPPANKERLPAERTFP